MFLLQAPGETLDYTLDWSDFLADVGSPQDEISTSEWWIEPVASGSPTSPAISGQNNDTYRTSCFVSNVTRGQLYTLFNKVETVLLRTSIQTIAIRADKR